MNFIFLFCANIFLRNVPFLLFRSFWIKVGVGSPPNTSTSARGCRVPLSSQIVVDSIRSYRGIQECAALERCTVQIRQGEPRPMKCIKQTEVGVRQPSQPHRAQPPLQIAQYSYCAVAHEHPNYAFLKFHIFLAQNQLAFLLLSVLESFITQLGGLSLLILS